ncbi:hypothetical protein [Stutzerimonas stutzeri]
MLKTFALYLAIAIGGLSAGAVGAFYGVAVAGKAPQLTAELSALFEEFTR